MTGENINRYSVDENNILGLRNMPHACALPCKNVKNKVQLPCKNSVEGINVLIYILFRLNIFFQL